MLGYRGFRHGAHGALHRIADSDDVNGLDVVFHPFTLLECDLAEIRAQFSDGRGDGREVRGFSAEYHRENLAPGRQF